MPHINLKCFPAEISAEQKETLINEMTSTITKVFSCPDQVVSIVLEQIEPEKWPEVVVKPELEGKVDKVIKTPVY